MEHTTCPYWDPSTCEGTVHCPPRCPRFVDERGDEWLIEPTRPTACDTLVDMYVDFADDQRSRGLPPRTRAGIERWLDEFLAAGCNFLARSDDRVVGHAAYTPADAPAPELVVFVHQDYQDRGLGTELCRHVVATAAAGDREALVLEVEPDNTAAIRVYRSLGFERADAGASGTRGSTSRAFEMRLPLSPARATAAQRSPAFRA